MRRILVQSLFALTVLAGAQPVRADTDGIEIIIKNHRFEPAEVRVPADKKIKLIVKNQDSTPEEFESHDLNREKIIAGNSQATILVGPLQPGEYSFFGEFNEATAQGKLVVGDASEENPS
ncbi:MAG: cupredoxin domain-containing protein [Bdellovibrionales bacterium]|nr:cupredoxin domain-containing protein [Bdellovibrionales bacterium]